jgi:hypothetical protein
MINRYRHGAVFLMTIILLSIAVFMSSTLSIMVLRDVYAVKRFENGQKAYFLAEAGVEEALKNANEDFDSIPSGYTNTLGEGTYTVTVVSLPTELSRKLIVSTGTIKGISRTLNIQIRYTGPAAFNYPALGGGWLTIAGNSVISDSSPINVHSNSPGNYAVSIGERRSTGRVEGNASACGRVVVHDPNGTVTGTVPSYAPYVELPPFNDNFFQYYYNLALADDNVKYGVVTFKSDPCAGKPNHVCYVIGQARLKGTWDMTGCIVATGKIIINKWHSGHVTQHQWQNLPAFMSKNSDIEIYDPTDIEGMVYAGGYIHIDSAWGIYGPVSVYGTLYGKSWVNIQAMTQLHYRRPNPPGLTTGPIGVEVLSWSSSS